ncbi:hypothetical protein D3C75_714440 [compost metagenome]
MRRRTPGPVCGKQYVSGLEHQVSIFTKRCHQPRIVDFFHFFHRLLHYRSIDGRFAILLDISAEILDLRQNNPAEQSIIHNIVAFSQLPFQGEHFIYRHHIIIKERFRVVLLEQILVVVHHVAVNIQWYCILSAVNRAC